jgi:hypothetical protein
MPATPDQAQQFVQGVVLDLTWQEAASGVDLIAMETGLALSFTGGVTDYTWQSDGQTRQLGRGTLDVMATFDNARQAEVASFSAVSGPVDNGVIPNGTFKAYAPTDAANQFPDETGTFGFKMVLEPQQQMDRNAFRIHSVSEKSQRWGTKTAGCIGLDGGHGENVAFNALMADYFKTKKVINVSVDLAGNANVVRQLGNQPHY